MSKKEKYYNYVVNDLVSKTEIDHDKKRIKFPFHSLYTSFFYSFPPSPILLFSKYITERYGTHDGEIKIIWNLYKEKIHSLIKK
tara:strand:+ start:1266 stop:1517 length:252 start_codon:yes stop_codon:yes gene_type:complete